MRKLLLTAMLTVAGLISVSAQSMEKEDYVQAFVYDNQPHFIDESSLAYAKNGNVVFWSLTVYKDALFFLSSEVDCTKRLLRLRSVRMAPGDGKVYTKKGLTGWMAPNDPVANRYIASVCAERGWND